MALLVVVGAGIAVVLAVVGWRTWPASSDGNETLAQSFLALLVDGALAVAIRGVSIYECTDGTTNRTKAYVVVILLAVPMSLLALWRWTKHAARDSSTVRSAGLRYIVVAAAVVILIAGMFLPALVLGQMPNGPCRD